MKATIIFDGGTTCNKPRLGLGEGYGSYKLNNRPIVRLKFGKPHTNNSAEVSTLYAAVVEAKSLGFYTMHFIGDSQIALNSCRPSAMPKHPKDKSSDMFLQARRDLQLALCYVSFTTEWWPRDKIFAVFGH